MRSLYCEHNHRQNQNQDACFLTLFSKRTSSDVPILLARDGPPGSSSYNNNVSFLRPGGALFAGRVAIPFTKRLN